MSGSLFVWRHPHGLGRDEARTMPTHTDYNANTNLSDDQLVQREASERREYQRLGDKEPHLRETNYRTLRASSALMHAWERWSKTATAMRLRGLLSRWS